MNTILSYLQSKTVQGILGLLVLGLMKNYHITIFDDATLATLALLFGGWLGIGIRSAMNPMPGQPPKQ